MLCYSTGSLPEALTSGPPHAVADALACWLLPTPFRGIEWVVRPEHLRRVDDAGFWIALRLALEARGFSVRNVHLGHPRLLGDSLHFPGLASLNPAARARRCEAALAAIRLATHLGSPHLTVTTGPSERSGGVTVAPGAPFARPSPPFAAGAASPDFASQTLALRDSLSRIVRAKPHPLALLIEQEPEMVLHSAGQLAEACRAFSGEVFANYDVGHGAVLGENLDEALTLLAPYLRNIHLEDIAERKHRHLLFGEGDIDFAGVFSALRRLDYAGDLTPDLYPFSENPGPALLASGAFLDSHGFRRKP